MTSGAGPGPARTTQFGGTRTQLRDPEPLHLVSPSTHLTLEEPWGRADFARSLVSAEWCWLSSMYGLRLCSPWGGALFCVHLSPPPPLHPTPSFRGKGLDQGSANLFPGGLAVNICGWGLLGLCCKDSTLPCTVLTQLTLTSVLPPTVEFFFSCPAGLPILVAWETTVALSCSSSAPGRS